MTFKGNRESSQFLHPTVHTSVELDSVLAETFYYEKGNPIVYSIYRSYFREKKKKKSLC